MKYTFGGKLSFINTNSAFDYFDTTGNQIILDPLQSNKFDYKENIQALYANAEKKLKKWEFQFGLRVESTQTTGYSENLNQTDKNNYIKLFPTLYISHTLNDDNVFNLNYSKRIGRPSYYMANPFKIYQNQFSYVEGNPFIKPEYAHLVELSHTYKNNLNTSLNFMYLQDGKSQVQIVDANDNTLKSTYLNFFKAYTYNLNITHTFNKWKWWESNNSLIFSHNYVIADENLNNQKIKTSNFYISSNNTFILNSGKTLLAGLDVSYQSPYGINIIKYKERFNTNLSFKYLLMDKNMQFSLILSDIFRTGKGKFSNFSNNILIQNNNYYDNQYFRIAVSYKFGNKKVNVEQHDTGNEDEKERVYGD